MSYEEKAKHMVSTLPRKRKGWFQSFLWCLQQSTTGTGHDMIYEALISKHEELRKCVCDDKIDDSINVTKEVIIHVLLVLHISMRYEKILSCMCIEVHYIEKMYCYTFLGYR